MRFTIRSLMVLVAIVAGLLAFPQAAVLLLWLLPWAGLVLVLVLAHLEANPRRATVGVVAGLILFLSLCLVIQAIVAMAVRR